MESCVNSRCDHLFHSDESSHMAPGLQTCYLCLGKQETTVQRRNLHGFLICLCMGKVENIGQQSDGNSVVLAENT